MALEVERLGWTDIALAAIDLPKKKLELTLGLGSGLVARDGRIFAITDRGPNLFISQAVDDYGLRHLDRLRANTDAKVLPLPWMGPEIVELQLEGCALRPVRRMELRTAAGVRLSGMALPGGEMESVYDIAGRVLIADPLGADTEAIAAMPDGGFFAAEEYGPSLLKTDADGVVSERWVPAGREAELAVKGLAVRGALPKKAVHRRANRGFEALCASEDGTMLYLGFQSALRGEADGYAPVWKLDAKTGALVGEWLYPFDPPNSFRRDAARRKVDGKDLKVCEFAWAGEDRLVVLERISHSSRIYLIDLARLPEKRLLVSSDDHPKIGPDIEGMALLDPRQLLICSDNDFGVEGAETGFWRIRLDEALA